MKLLKLKIFILIFFLYSSCHKNHPAADLIILGGRIYTVNNFQPVVEAVAVKGNKVLFSGLENEARKYWENETEVIDLKGQIMTPGFIEGHAHIMGVGYNELELDLMAVKSYDELVSRVADAVKKAKPGQWIVGRGWHQDKWNHKPDKMVKGFQTHHLLSQVSPDNPVFLRHASGHAGLANKKAMEISGMNALSKEIMYPDNSETGGEIIRDSFGNPTGIFNERAMRLIVKNIPSNTKETDEEALALALQACVRNGITGLHDAGATRENIALFRKFKKENRLLVRLYVMLSGAEPDLIREWLGKGPELDPDHQLTIRSIKLNCDGALGSRGAWLLEPYTDRKDFYGMATFPMDTVLKISREALKHGFQVCAHAIGDRANREILDKYEMAIKENSLGAGDHRFRIEHAQHLHPADIKRFGELGVIPAMQAIHMSSDRPWAIDRLGEKRIKTGAYMWQSLLRSGAKIVNGSDAPVESINPIPSFYASVTRKTLAGTPAGGYEPAEKMTREQALKSFTLDAAYGAFEEKSMGSIEPGKLADFTIFSKDLMHVEEDKILETEVMMTIIGGKVVFKK